MRALEKAHKVNIVVKENGEVSIMGKEAKKAKKSIESLIEKC